MSTFLQYQEVLRNWLLVIFATIGSWLAISTYRANLKQRKLENTFRTIEFLRRHITGSEVEDFISLFHAGNPLAGHDGHFLHKDGRIEEIKFMFSDGGSGNGSIYNMLEVFNLVSPSLRANSVEASFIWYEYGQIMSTCYDWVVQSELPKPHILWPEFQRYMKTQPWNKNTAMKFYVQAE